MKLRKKAVRVRELKVGDHVIIHFDQRIGLVETYVVESIEPSKSGATVRIKYAAGIGVSSSVYHPKAPAQPTLDRYVQVLDRGSEIARELAAGRRS